MPGLYYLSVQGYWVCTFVAVLSFIFLVVGGQPITGVAVLLFYYFGGVGVREHSRYAAAVIFVMYLADTVLSPGVLRVIICGLMLSNLRATWIAANWRLQSEEAAAPRRLNETFADKLADQLPLWLWPKARVAHYIYSASFVLLVAARLTVIGLRTKVAH